MKTSTREKWKNIVRYVTATHAVMEDKNEQEQLRIEQEMYAWLEKNYQITWNQRTLKKMRDNFFHKL